MKQDYEQLKTIVGKYMDNRNGISYKMAFIKLLLASCMVIFISSWASCGEVDQPIASHLFFGTVTSTTVDASGSWAYFRILSEGANLNEPPLFITSCQLSGPVCDFQINQLPEGRYTVFGLIDQNDDAERINPLPNSGDLLSPGRPLILLSRQEMDFPDNAWRLLP